MNLAYQAYDRAGQVVSGNIAASDEKEAGDRLFKDGLFLISISRAAGGGKTDTGAATRTAPGGRGVSLRELSAFTRQLTVLASTGSQIVQAIAAVERQIPQGRWRGIVADVRARVEEGQSLVTAMEHHPGAFPPVYRSLIAAGESGGQMAKMLSRLSELTRRQSRNRQQIAGAMVYPALLLVVSFVVVIVMLTTVLPRFTGLFDTLDAPVPASTQVLMSISGVLRTYWLPLAAGLAAVVGGGIAYFRSAAGQAMLDVILLRVPIVSKVVKGLVTARIARTLGVLLESRVPMLEALRLTRQAAGNREYAAIVEHAEEVIIRGESMSVAFRGTSLIPPSVYEAVVTGERTGQIGPVLMSVSDFLDEDNEVLVKSLTSLLEPLILIVLGVVVGFVAISMFLPLFDLTTATQAG